MTMSASRSSVAGLYSKLWRWLAHNGLGNHPVPSGSPHFNRDKLDDLIGHLGPGKVEQTLLALEKELCRCFKSDLAQSRREAHDLINTAGALGLETLLECARALNEADPSSDEAFRALARCRETRDGGPGDHCRNDFAAAHRVDPSKDGIVSRRCITVSRDADRIQPVRVSIAYSDVQFQLPRGARASSSAASLAKSGLSRT